MDPPNMDIELFEALLANMQQNLPQGAYDDLDDDDDDDDYDEDDDDDDDDYDYAGHEHSIHTMANPYGAGDGGVVGGGDLGGGEMGGVSLPTMQTMSMSILQGLLNMNPGAVPDMGGGGMSGSVNTGLQGMGSAVESGANSFLNNMPSFLPSMNPDMAGALAGAFAGGMTALMDGYAGAGGGGGGATIHDYDEDDDDELLSDEEDDEDDDELEERRGINPVTATAAGVAVGAVGGMVSSGLLSSSHPSTSHLVQSSHPGHPSHPAHAAIPGHGQRPPSHAHIQSHAPLPSHTPAVGFTNPYNPTDMMGPSPPTTHGQRSHNLAVAAPSSPLHHTSMAPSMSGGSVRSVDPLAGVSMSVAGIAAGASILAPVVSSLLASSDSKPLAKLDTSDASSVTLVDDDSINSPTKSLPIQDRPAESISVNATAAALEKTRITQPEKDESKPITVMKKSDVSDDKKYKNDSDDEENKDKNIEVTPQCRIESHNELEDDKSSVGSDSVPGSEDAGDGKSDTESVRKKTPSPVLDGKLGRLSPTGSESTPVLESASCASITDLASATESMRDSDTDNHSDAHNVTANLSDLDNDLHENQPKVHHTPQYAVGALPIVIEKPTFGWQSMVGLDTAKEALKNLFMTEAFPEVFEGTQGTCKGVLLFGPSGSGKTCLARALAKESNDAILIGISTAYLSSQAPLEAPKIVRYLFDHARMHNPAVILFDEVDALCYDRGSETALRAKAELLAQIRGLTTLNPPYPPLIDPVAFNDGIMVLGTTNQPWLLEDDLRRIFTYNIHVKLPSEKAREELLRMFLQNLKHNINDDQFKCLVAKSEGYSAADINTVIRRVAHMPQVEPSKFIQNMPRVITYDDLATVMTEYRCRFTSEVSLKYQCYIKAATHKSDERQDDSKKEKERPKGVKRFGQRIAKSIAAALVAVID